MYMVYIFSTTSVYGVHLLYHECVWCTYSLPRVCMVYIFSTTSVYGTYRRSPFSLSNGYTSNCGPIFVTLTVHPPHKRAVQGSISARVHCFKRRLIVQLFAFIQIQRTRLFRKDHVIIVLLKLKYQNEL